MCMEVGSDGSSFTESFEGINIQVEVPYEINDELTGNPIDHAQVLKG